ncbi:hypothetical protein F511_10911 [Dorcoceras hygrometricum]|uniref:Uncharacterized protein n=1 Tax=Dorcoceras hygrometricum TaxID=472368 RepID=A0A2Z7CQL3_9LAMI|nr:hypothetical protein F511_10911 [Dorcoceras hygrometricum]
MKLVRVKEDARYSRNDKEFEEAHGQNSLDFWFNCIDGEGKIFKDIVEFRTYLKNYVVVTRRLYINNIIFGIKKCNLQHTCGETIYVVIKKL